MKIVLFQLILMFGIFVQGVAGFGGTLLSMPLGIMVMGIGVTKPVMTIVAWLCAVIVVVTDRKYVNWKVLFKMVAVMLVGVIGGLWVSGKLQLNFLLIIYGIVVAAIGIRRLFFPPKKEPGRAIQGIALALAGVMQGLFVSGGSFLAVYAVAQMKDKREFRATVNAVWALINTVMIISYITGGILKGAVLTQSLIAIVPTLFTVWLSGALTKKIKQQTFLKIIYVILICSGLVLLITNLT